MGKTDELLALLPTLPVEDLQRVKDQATLLLALSPKSALPRVELRAGGEQEFARDLYDALAAELLARTQVPAPHWNIFSRHNQFHSHFKPGAAAAYAANLAWFPKQSRAERASMLQLYARLVLDGLAAQGRPSHWHWVSDALRNLHAVVDSAFPGYAASGLLTKVQQLRTRPSRPPV